MTWTFSKAFFDAYAAFKENFPEANWGPEGCGLDEPEVIDLMNRSVADGIDRLSPTYPVYPAGAIIA
ncbi:hypothetical protein [Dubosiella newyorkensis]|uniref:hypothetical protein n=1 Tax=Dubosiella newyorkensis TaxID=1862672 RepID=UPI00259D1733|nr:hypothetical protein [Dubosiella newyorkensis]